MPRKCEKHTLSVYAKGADMGYIIRWYPMNTRIRHISGIPKTCRNGVHHELVCRENVKSAHYRYMQKVRIWGTSFDGTYPMNTRIRHISGISKTCRNGVHHKLVCRENVKSTHYRYMPKVQIWGTSFDGIP